MLITFSQVKTTDILTVTIKLHNNLQICSNIIVCFNNLFIYLQNYLNKEL